MRRVEMSLEFTEDNGLRSVTIHLNETELETDSKLLKRIAVCILQALKENKDSVEMQDDLHELGVSISKEDL